MSVSYRERRVLPSGIVIPASVGSNRQFDDVGPPERLPQGVERATKREALSSVSEETGRLAIVPVDLLTVFHLAEPDECRRRYQRLLENE